MQGTGHATEEERRNGFERGGWAMGRFDDESVAFITETYQRADAFLFGRRTYEMFSDTWGTIAEMRANPIGVALNEKPKYVASTTLTDPHWTDTTILSGKLAEAIGELKGGPTGDLQVHGSGTLIRWLLEHNLVDELTLLVVPIVLGQDTRLFPEVGMDLAFDLIDSRADSKGSRSRSTGPPADLGTRRTSPPDLNGVTSTSPTSAASSSGRRPGGESPAEVQRLPAAVAGRLVVVVAQPGAPGPGQTAEHDHRIRRDEVRQDLHTTTLSIQPGCRIGTRPFVVMMKGGQRAARNKEK